MKELFSDFDGLKKHLKGSGLNFREALIDYYRQLGETQGFTALTGSSLIKNAVNYGKMDLVWVEPNVVFAAEFGLLDDVYKHLFRMMVASPGMAVLLLSGNSQCNPGRVKEIVEKTPQLKDIEFVILDVSTGRTI